MRAVDRRAVVDRHAVTRTAADALEPLTVGNGELAFTADVTGLQTLARLHDEVAARAQGRPAMGLHTQAQWGFHEMPNPHGWDLDDVMSPYDTPRGPVDYPDRYDFRKGPADLTDDERAGYWLWVNPQRLDLMRLGLDLGDAVEPDELEGVDQRLDCWSGVLTSRFRHAGETFTVTTACHPDQDAIAVRVESPALADGRAGLALAFPYASDTFAGTAEWDAEAAHTTDDEDRGDRTRLLRTLDATRYTADLTAAAPGGDAAVLRTGPHRFRIAGSSAVLEVVIRLGPDADDAPVPTVADVLDASAAGWAVFWRSGAALDLAGSTDPRAHELERRTVLSQYLTRVQSAGSTPPAETGLTQNSWAGKFHLEMHWWHAAHFAMWGRPELLERSLAWYLGAMPVARDIARRQGLPGVRWPKHVGPEGRESPNEIGPLLVWQQPHPIHLAELVRQARPDDAAEVLERYGAMVEETAELMTALLSREPDGVHLPPPIMPAQERYDPRTVQDPAFELAYFVWALETAQAWRGLRGLPRDPERDRLLADVVPLPVQDGRLAAVGGPPRTEIGDHPSMLGAVGVVPRTRLIDDGLVTRTVRWVSEHWDWDTAWGWDFPTMAMAATRAGEPALAVDTLLMASPRNRYLSNGHNCQDPLGLPLYLPGNGGTLAAVALMAAGWTGGPRDAPGFPAEGWSVRAEGFPDRP